MRAHFGLLNLILALNRLAETVEGSINRRNIHASLRNRIHGSPDQSEQHGMIERYTGSITEAGGTIHRLEDGAVVNWLTQSTSFTKLIMFL